MSSELQKHSLTFKHSVAFCLLEANFQKLTVIGLFVARQENPSFKQENNFEKNGS